MKLNEKEIEVVKSLQTKLQSLVFSFGQNEIASQKVQEDKKAIQAEYEKIKKEENDFMQLLLKEYGPGELTLTDFTFTPATPATETK